MQSDTTQALARDGKIHMSQIPRLQHTALTKPRTWEPNPNPGKVPKKQIPPVLDGMLEIRVNGACVQACFNWLKSEGDWMVKSFFGQANNEGD